MAMAAQTKYNKQRQNVNSLIDTNPTLYEFSSGKDYYQQKH